MVTETKLIVNQTRDDKGYPRFLVMLDKNSQPILYTVGMIIRNVSDKDAKLWYEELFGETNWVN